MMNTTPRCAICDCDREGNVWPESANALCAAHLKLAGKRDLVLRGALSDWEPMGAKGTVLVSHRDMLLTKNPQSAASRPWPWRATVLTACSCRAVFWDDGTGDAADSEGDRYALMTGLIASWVWYAVERALMERNSDGKAA